MGNLNGLTMKKDWEKYWKHKEVKITINKKRMMKILNKHAYKNKVLDAGCGSGFFSKYFAGRDCEIISLDYSKEALKLTQELNPKIMPIRGNLLCTPFENGSFDLIFSDGLLEHYKNPTDILLEFKRILKKNGIITTFAPNKYSYWLFVKPFILKGIKEYRFTLRELIKLHEKIGFKILEFGGFSVFPLEISPDFLGKYLGRLIYVIARKG